MKTMVYVFFSFFMFCAMNLNAQSPIEIDTVSLRYVNGFTNQHEIVDEYRMTNHSNEEYITWVSLEPTNDKSNIELVHDFFKEQQHCLQLAARREHDGGQSQQTAHHIQRRHRLLLVESHIHHAVVDVPAVRRHGALPARHAAHDGKGRVEDRQSKHQKRHRERNDSVILKEALNGIGR